MKRYQIVNARTGGALGGYGRDTVSEARAALRRAEERHPRMELRIRDTETGAFVAGSR